MTPKPPLSSPRERILAGARQHFFAHGFRSVTMDELAAELGMSKKTLYAHFPSKLVLLEAMVLRKLETVDEAMEKLAQDHANDFGEAVQALFATLQRETGEICPPFFRDLQKDAPEIFLTVQTRRAAMIHRHFGRLLKRGVEEGGVRSDIPVQLVVEILAGAVQAIVNPVKLDELGLAPKTALMPILKIFLEGVLTDKGRGKA